MNENINIADQELFVSPYNFPKYREAAFKENARLFPCKCDKVILLKMLMLHL